MLKSQERLYTLLRISLEPKPNPYSFHVINGQFYIQSKGNSENYRNRKLSCMYCPPRGAACW